MKHKILLGDAFELIDELDLNSINLILTSPPYWAKRRYSEESEIGAEPTPVEYVNDLADCFDRFRPYLKDDGNLFVNIGDTFFGSGAGAWRKYLDESGEITRHQKDRKEKYFTLKPLQPKIKQDGRLYQNKQLLLIPSRFAIAMQERGWILRDDIIWYKPNRIPASVKDRFNCMYEHVYHFVRSKKYYFDLDAVKVPKRTGVGKKNPGDVWDIKTQPLAGSHTATFPEELAERVIRCASPKGGVVFDPFLGTGTTWLAAHRLQRSCTGFDISRDFLDYAIARFNSAFSQRELDPDWLPMSKDDLERRRAS